MQGIDFVLQPRLLLAGLVGGDLESSRDLILRCSGKLSGKSMGNLLDLKKPHLPNGGDDVGGLVGHVRPP
jgi:hypothetical protein